MAKSVAARPDDARHRIATALDRLGGRLGGWRPAATAVATATSLAAAVEEDLLSGYRGQQVRVRLNDGHELSGRLTRLDVTSAELRHGDGGGPGAETSLVSRHAIAAVLPLAGAAVPGAGRAAGGALPAGGRWAVPLPVPGALSHARTAFLLFFVGYVVYGITYGNDETIYTQYLLLADAFLHGRLDLIAPGAWLELAQWEGRYYVQYPPFPAVLLVPFVAIFGADFPQGLLSTVLGAINVALAYRVLSLVFPQRVAVWTSVLFAFGTVHWYHASVGSPWYLAQVAAICCLWLAMWEALTRGRLFLIGLAIACAYLSRYPTLFAAVFPVVLFWERFWIFGVRRPDGGVDLLRWMKPCVQLGSGLAIGFIANAVYNQARWGTIDSIGYTLVPGFEAMAWFRHGLVDIRYVREHVEEMLLGLPRFRSEWPYVVPNVYAMSVLFTTPAFILAAVAGFRDRFVLASGAAAFAVLVPILLHGGSGFTQFGYRYTLDFTPFLLVLVAAGMRGVVRRWTVALIVVSIAVNLWGVVMLRFLDIWSF